MRGCGGLGRVQSERFGEPIVIPRPYPPSLAGTPMMFGLLAVLAAVAMRAGLQLTMFDDCFLWHSVDVAQFILAIIFFVWCCLLSEARVNKKVFFFFFCLDESIYPLK